MLAYIIRRLLTVIPVVLGVMLLTFVLFRMIGGNPAYRIAGKNATRQRIAEISHQNGYFKPKIFGFWSKEMVQEEEVSGVTSGVNNSYALKPADGKITLPLMIVDPDYGKTYRLTFRASAPQGGAMRLFTEESDSPNKSRKLRVEKKLSASSSEAFSTEVETDTMEKALAQVAGNELASHVEVRFVIEFEGAEATLSAVEAASRQSNPFDSQLKDVMWSLVRFDLGESKETKQRVSTMFVAGLWPSLAITTPAFVMGLLLAIAISLVCAYYRDSWLDRTLVVVAVIGISINVLIYCIVMQDWTAAKLQHLGLPIWGFEGVRYLLLPLFIDIVGGLGGSVRFYRTIMLNERYQDYVRTAQAKGCADISVLFRHMLKNAMIPILTAVVIYIPFLYTGALLLENFFGIPGLGNITVQAIQNGDEPVIFASVFIGSIIFVFANLLTDLSYVLVDPRIRLK